MTNPDYRALCAELVDALDSGIPAGRIRMSSLADRARALLAEQPVSPPYKLPEAEGPTDEELADLMPTRFLVNQAASARAIANIGTDEQVAQVRAILDGEAIAYARAVLARLGRPTPQPVAVSERLPGPEDCNEQGRCWLGGRQMGSGTTTWLLGYPAWAERFPDVHRFWLPANALPLPAPEGGEVQP